VFQVHGQISAKRIASQLYTTLHFSQILPQKSFRDKSRKFAKNCPLRKTWRTGLGLAPMAGSRENKAENPKGQNGLKKAFCVPEFDKPTTRQENHGAMGMTGLNNFSTDGMGCAAVQRENLLLTPTQLSKRWGFSKHTILKLNREGTLPSIEFNSRTIRFPLLDIVAIERSILRSPLPMLKAVRKGANHNA
jgi:hypothetical protein